MVLWQKYGYSAWRGVAHFILEAPGRGLFYFDTADDVVNWLFTQGSREAARDLHRHIKDGE